MPDNPTFAHPCPFARQSFSSFRAHPSWGTLPVRLHFQGDPSPSSISQLLIRQRSNTMLAYVPGDLPYPDRRASVDT